MGADGYIPSLAPLFPKPHVELYEAAKRGDLEKTKKWGEIVDEACKIFGMAKSQTSSTKYALSKLGFLNPRVIWPTEPITREEQQHIDEHIASLKAYMA